MPTPVALDDDVLTGWWWWHEWRKVNPNRVEKEVRLQGVWGKRRAGLGVPFQLLSSPPVPMAQPWY